ATVRNGEGELVRTIDLGRQTAGPHRFEFDGKNGNGVQVPDGSYTLEIKALAPGAETPKKVALTTRGGCGIAAPPPRAGRPLPEQRRPRRSRSPRGPWSTASTSRPSRRCWSR